MKRLTMLTAASLILVVLPAATAGDAPEDIREQNREWILEHNPAYDPDAIVEMHRGEEGVETMSAADALELTLDRAGDRSLPDLAKPRVHGDTAPVWLGDIWILGTRNVECGNASQVTHTPLTPIYTLSGAEIYVYDGNLSYVTGASADTWTLTDWYLATDVPGSGEVHYGGNVDRFCFEGPGLEILFPWINGYATTLASPPVVFEGPLV